MKRVCKGPSPKSLNDFIAVNLNATWEDMSDLCIQVVDECREQAMREQGHLCAYCEQKISSDNPRHRRIEHFHPKSDRSGTHNWGLDWGNMFAVCDGGSASSQEDREIYPLPSNLSCDAHKDYMIQTHKLPIACEGHLISPLDIPAFPNVFSFEKGTWHLVPDTDNCAKVKIDANVYDTTAELIHQSIKVLNLNCDRLTDIRKRLVYNIERNKKKLRDSGYAPDEMPKRLVQRYFTDRWPEYFTTLRCLLGTAAEDYLKSVEFNG